MKSAPATPEKPATVLSAAPEAASAEPKPPEQGAAKPEPAKPEAAKPEAAKPEAAKPEAAKPGAVAQAKPVQTPTPVVAKPLPPAAPSPAQAAVLATLEEWARAWSARDVEGYLGFYATDFDPIGRQTREQWAAERRERLGAAQSIAVVLEDAEVQMADPARAVVTLVQGYTAAHYSDRTRKQFTLVKAGDRWLIRSEKSLGIVR
jgi:ketosteroid isomerase-like protein